MSRAQLRLARAASAGAAVLTVAFLPRVLSDFRASQFALVAVYFVALLGLNVLTGVSGQISLAHGAFMAVGAYTTAILVSDQGLRLGGHTFASDVKDVYTIPVAGAVAALAGVALGVPALRLTGLYVALATFAVAVSLPPVLRKADSLTGGSSGINLFGLPGHTGDLAGVDVLGRQLTFNDWLYYLCWTVALVMLGAAWLLLRGRTGRALRAVRDSEVAAAASGVSPAAYKTLAFAVGALYAGVAGSLYAIALAFVNPESFPVMLSVTLLVGLVFGGVGSLWPLVFGALLIQFLPDLAQRVSDAPGSPAIVYGAVLVAAMLVLPTGVAGLLGRLVDPLTGRSYTRP